MQRFLDKVAPFTAGRWAAWASLAVLYFLRVWMVKGFYIVTYSLGIYNLDLLAAFVTPKFLPVPVEAQDDGPTLPTKSSEEFKPFVRKLPEFKFWWASTRGFLLGLFCTLFPFLDFPVFWPILLFYFLTLVVLISAKRIEHMRQYKYSPFTWGKPGKGRAANAGGASKAVVEGRDD